MARQRDFERTVDTILKWLLGVSGTLFVIGTLLTFINVIMRKVFSNPWAGMEELDSLLLVILVYLPLAYLEWGDRHFNVNLLYDRFPSRVRFWCKKLQHLLTLVIAVVIACGTWDVILRNFVQETKSATIGIPLFIPYSLLMIGFGLTALVCLIRLMRFKKGGEGHAS